MGRARGLTLIELLVVLAMLGVLFTLTAFQSRRVMAEQDEAAFYTRVQRIFWDASTAAASRGQTLLLIRNGDTLIVREKGGSRKVLRRVEIPEGMRVSLPEGRLAVFTPPGRVRFRPRFPQDCEGPSFKVTTPGGSERCYRVSVIGEVEEVRP